MCLIAGLEAAAATPGGYKINVGDELELDILDDNEPPQRFTVGRDGEVQLPYIGGLAVAAIAVSDARELIRRTYVTKEIFVNPTVELSIASFRPVFVLGDVAEPGNYSYQPFLTAEQAVGLAGGPSVSANNEEARVLERRSLEGALNSLDYELALLAAQYARIQAQLAGSAASSWSDVPHDVRPEVDRELFGTLKVQEDQIIVLEAEDAAVRRELLSEAAAEAEKRISLLAQRAGLQSKALDNGQAELDRLRGMADRGLTPKANVNEQELLVTQLESQLLQLREQKSAALIQLADLRSQLSQFDAAQRKKLLSDSQEYWSGIKKLISDRASVEDRMHLLQQWMNAAAGLETELLVKYQVRRREGSSIRNIILDPYDELVPGDLLVVVVKPPEALREPG